MTKAGKFGPVIDHHRDVYDFVAAKIIWCLPPSAAFRLSHHDRAQVPC
jgi:hypothetical protein